MQNKKKESSTPKKKKLVKTDTNLSEESKKRKERVKAKVTAYRQKKIKTIEDIIQEQAESFNMNGSENISLDQIERMLTQIAIGNAKDGLTGMPPTTKERMDAFKQLCEIKKNKVDESAIDEHNESIKELEWKNNYENAPNRDIKDLM